jgi:hypothetical protein
MAHQYFHVEKLRVGAECQWQPTNITIDQTALVTTMSVSDSGSMRPPQSQSDSGEGEVDSLSRALDVSTAPEGCESISILMPVQFRDPDAIIRLGGAMERAEEKCNNSQSQTARSNRRSSGFDIRGIICMIVSLIAIALMIFGSVQLFKMSKITESNGTCTPTQSTISAVGNVTLDKTAMLELTVQYTNSSSGEPAICTFQVPNGNYSVNATYAMQLCPDWLCSSQDILVESTRTDPDMSFGGAMMLVVTAFFITYCCGVVLKS